MHRTGFGSLLAGFILAPALAASDTSGKWQQLFDQASAAQREGEPSRARRILQRALRAATPAEAIFTHYAIGGTEEFLARYSDAEKSYRAGLDILHAHSVPDDQRHMWEARFHNARGVIRLHLRDLNTAEDHFRAALRESLLAGDLARIDQAGAHSNLSDLLYRRGFHREALGGFNEAIGLYRAAQPLAALPLCYALANAALAAARLKDLPRADQLSREALETFTDTLGTLNPRRAGFLRIRAEILKRTDRPKEARALRQQAESLPRDPAVGAFLDVAPYSDRE